MTLHYCFIGALRPFCNLCILCMFSSLFRQIVFVLYSSAPVAFAVISRTASASSLMTSPERGIVCPFPVSKKIAVSGSQTLYSANAPCRKGSIQAERISQMTNTPCQGSIGSSYHWHPRHAEWECQSYLHPRPREGAPFPG